MKKKIIFLSIFILLLTIGGALAFYITKSRQNTFVYGQDEVAKFKTDTQPAPTDGTTPLDHSSYDNITYILWVLEHTEQYSSLTEGTAVSVGQKQTIYNHRRVNGNEQLVDTISGGLITLGKQKYFKDGKVLLRDYVSKDGDEIIWKTDEPECISNSQYLVRYGWLPTQATAYIICEETILEISEMSEREDGLFSITLSLNPDRDYAPFWYQREVATNASSLEEVKFSSIVIEYIFDANWIIREVNTKEKYEVTPKVAPLRVSCETNITEKFTYEKPDFGSALDFFEQYKDLVPSDGFVSNPSENTPLSYITGSLLNGSEKEHTFKVLIEIDDKVIEGKLALDISNLNDISVKVSLGDLQVVYDSKVVYIDYNNLKLKCNIDEAASILQPLLEELFYGETPSDFSSSLDVSQIMNDINEALVTETDDGVRLDLTLNIMGVSMPLSFDIMKVGDDLDLRSIVSNLDVLDKDISISILKDNSITFMPIEGDYNNLNSLEYLINDITQILRNKKFVLTFNLHLENYELSGTAFIHTTKEEPLKLVLNLINNQNGINEQLTLYYDYTYFYLSYQENRVKLSLEDLLGFLKQQGLDFEQFNTLSFNDIYQIFSNVDFSTILNGLIIENDRIKLDLNLSSFCEILQNLSITLLDTEEGFTIKVDPYDVLISLDTKTDFSTEFDQSQFIDVNHYLDIVEFINNLIEKKSFKIELDGYFNIANQMVPMSGTVKLYLENDSYQLDGRFIVSICGELIPMNVILKDNILYFSVFDHTIRVECSSLVSLLSEFGMVVPSSVTESALDITLFMTVLHSLKIEDSRVEIDLSVLSEMLGKIQMDFLLNDNILFIELGNNSMRMNMRLSETEIENILLPTSYYTEKDILNVLEYIKDIKEIYEQKHVAVQGSLSYNEIGIDFDLYVDFSNDIEAIGTIDIRYKGEVYQVNIAYQNSYIYISYKDIRIKLEQNLLFNLLPSTELPEIAVEEILSLLKEFQIEDEFILFRFLDNEFKFIKTTEGIEIETTLYGMNINVNKNRIEEIHIDDESYTNICGYVDFVQKVLEFIGKESFSLEIEGQIDILDHPIILNGTIDFVLNENNDYDMGANLCIAYNNFKIEFEIAYVNHQIYVKLYDNVAVFNIDELQELLNYISSKLSTELDLSKNFDLADLEALFPNILLKPSSIVMDFSQYLSILSCVEVSFTADDSISLILSSMNNFEIFIKKQPVTRTSIEEYDVTLTKDDIFILVDNGFTLLDIVLNQAVHMDVNNAVISFMMNGELKQVKLFGNLDILFAESFQMIGHFDVEGFGCLASIDIILDKDVLYITISDQTICLKLGTLDTFLSEIQQILAPVYSIDLDLNQTNLDINFDLANLNIQFTNHSLEVDLTELLGKVCEISFIFGLSLSGLEATLTGNYDHVSFTLPVEISKSLVEQIDIPSKCILEEDILSILEYFVDAYLLLQEKEHNFQIMTSIYSNGSRTADITGSLYIKIFEDNQFDARFKAIINEYRNDEIIGWHQLDIQIISIETLKLLGVDSDTAMMYAIYGNNPQDEAAVIKVKSSYTGIEALIESILQLMNIDIPSISPEQTKALFNISSLLHNIEVNKEQFSISISANSLFEAMQDEEQFIQIGFYRSQGELSAISVSNLYLSYTNVKKNMKLEYLEIEKVSHSLDLILPTDVESYYDISNISYLFETFYNNAMEKNFEITGKITLQILSLLNINVPIDIKVNVDEMGMPIVFAELEIPYVFAMLSEKTVQIYYKDEYVYINRIEKGVSVRKVQIHYSVFMENIIYYLLDFAIGMPNSILEKIYNSDANGDGFVDASKCINEVVIGQDTFTFGINMGEIIDNFNLGNLTATLKSEMVAKTDENGFYMFDEMGNIIFVPMIYSIPNFKFTMVSIMNLNSSDLVLSNIQKNDDDHYVVHEVSLDALYSYISEFENNFNKDEEYIYSNGTWVSNGKIKHTIKFSMPEGDSIIKQYSLDDKISFPYAVNSILPILIDGKQKYFELIGWYYDDSYLKPIDDLNSVFMDNSNHTYYARLKEVTIEINVSSNLAFDDVVVYYEGFDFDSYYHELYSVFIDTDKLYQFKGLLDENGTLVDLGQLRSGVYYYQAFFEEVNLDFYLTFEDKEYILDPLNSELLLPEDAVVYNGEYFLYSLNVLTPQFIVKNFVNLFIFNESKQRLEIEFYSASNPMFNNFDLITFTTLDSFNNKNYYGVFYQKNRTIDLSGLLPNGSYDSFEINAWISDDATYYSWSDIQSISGSYEFTGYLSTKQEYFEFEEVNGEATITKYNGVASTVILPEYALVGGTYIVVTSIMEQTDDNQEKYSAFTANTSIVTLMFNESMAFIGSNAFKNCDGLVSVYLPKQIKAENIASDAFYFVKTGAFNFETARNLAAKITFYCTQQQKDSLDLIACSYNGSSRHYGKKESGFLGVGTADLTSSFAVLDYQILDVVYGILN